MKTLAITIQDGASGPLKGLAAKAKNPTPGLLIAGRVVGNLLKAHFRQKDTAGNRLGGERTHYWLRVGQSVNAPVPAGPDTVTVAISDPTFGHKVSGGTITAKRSKFLTIPIHPKAHGRRASVLESVLGKKLFAVKGVLAASEGGGKLTPYYALKRSVQQKPDATALPPERELQEAAQSAFNRWLGGS